MIKIKNLKKTSTNINTYNTDLSKVGFIYEIPSVGSSCLFITSVNQEIDPKNSIVTSLIKEVTIDSSNFVVVKTRNSTYEFTLEETI